MEFTPPPQPKYGALIELARKGKRISIQEAAERARVSKATWIDNVRGYRRRGAAWEHVEPKPETIAGMAEAVGLSPERLETEGQRPDAAEILGEIGRDEVREAAPPRPAPPPRRDVPFGGGDKDEGLRPWRQQVLREVYAAVGLASRFAPGEEVPDPSELPRGGEDLAAIPGRRLFPGPEREHEAGTWDDPSLTLREKINVIAVTRRLAAEADERERRRIGLTGNYPATSAMPVLISVIGMAVRASS